MDFRLNDEQLEFQQHCRRFAREVIRPVGGRARPRAERAVGRHQGTRASGASTGSTASQRMGADPDGMMGCIYAEELHWGCAGIALAISASARWPPPASPRSGTPEQIGALGARVLRPRRRDQARRLRRHRGRRRLRRASSLRTTAKLDGDEWVLNGTKVFITNGGIADVTVVVATVDPELGHRGQASFVVPKDTPGLSMGKKEDKLGIRASQTAEVVLEDCRIPMDNLLGGTEKLERSWSAPARAQTSGAPRARWRRSSSRVRWSAPRRSASPRPRTSGRSSTSRAAPRTTRPAARAAAHPAGAGRRGDRDRGRPPAGVARRLDGPQRHADDRRPGLDVEAQGRRRGDVGHDRR